MLDPTVKDRAHPQLVGACTTIPTHNLVFELFVTSVHMLFQPYSSPFFHKMFFALVILIFLSFAQAEVDRQANISGNQDSPEGGFDGMLQSVVCTDVS